MNNRVVSLVEAISEKTEGFAWIPGTINNQTLQPCYIK